MKKFLIILCCIIFLPFQSLKAYARIHLENLSVKSFNIPDNAAYIDMLIAMDVNDKDYVPLNEDNMKAYSFDIRKIDEYNDDGFISMSCHYKNVYTKMKVERINDGDNVVAHNSFTLLKSYDGKLFQDADLVSKFIREKRRFKIAVIDDKGNVIQVSKPFDITGKNGDLIKPISYDISNNSFKLTYEHDGEPLYFVRALNPRHLFIFFILVLTVIVVVIVVIRTRHKKK